MSPLPSPLPWAVLGCWLLATLPDALAALDYGMAFGAATASSQGRPPTRGQWAGWRAGHSHPERVSGMVPELRGAGGLPETRPTD